MNIKAAYIYLIFLIPVLDFAYTSGWSADIQPKEAGQIFVKYFSPRDYNSGYQNWCIAQDKRGCIYIGNNEGILEYDGVDWRLIKTPNNSVVRSLSIDESGRIYAAASSELGYLSPDSNGTLRYVSLLNFLPSSEKSFGDVWDVVAASNKIYFKTQDKIFRFNGNKFKIYNDVYGYRLYKIGDEVFVRSAGRGLLKITDDSLSLIPGGETFAETGVYNMLAYKGKVLIATNSEGLFLYDGIKFSPLVTEADSYLRANRIYNTVVLENNEIAFATQRGGAVIIDDEGKLEMTINSSNGLPSDIIYDVLPDKQGGLWLAMGEGIARAEIASSFSFIPEDSFYKDYISSLFRFDEKLYAANSFGLFYFDERAAKFEILEGENSNGSNFISIGGSLFAAKSNGVFRIENDTAQKLFDYTGASLFKSEIDSTIVYVLYRLGLDILKFENGKLNFIKNIQGFGKEVINLAEDKDGSLWIQTYYEGVIRLSAKNRLFSVPGESEIELEKFDVETGFPIGFNTMLTVDHQILFAAKKGLFRFDEHSGKFTPDSTMFPFFSEPGNSVLAYAKDKKNGFWILAETKEGRDLGKAVKAVNGTYSWKPVHEFRRLNLNSVFTFYADIDPATGSEILWISTDKGLIQYNANKDFHQKEFNVLIRSIALQNDSLIFGGYNDYNEREVILPHKNNVIRFTFSSLSFDKSDENRYQLFLEGKDEEWSNPTTTPYKEYTDLSAGDYTFRLRAVNIYGTKSTEAAFNFTVLAPWYLSFWVFPFYISIFAGLLFLIRSYELKRIKRKHLLRLERVEYKNLQELDKLKSKFFANISHEFRTPLTLILGQIDDVMSSAVNVNEKEKLQVADRNARRLLTLINQLLDLSKLEAGSMKLKAGRQNIVSFLKSLFYSFESLAAKKEITLRFYSDSDNIMVLFDPDKIENVFFNLLSNAIKFTDANGEVKVVLSTPDLSKIEIKISDTGKGIRGEDIPHLFDRFFQTDYTGVKNSEGTGIGLALAKELVELHKGKIICRSEEGKGTEFIVHLPLLGLSTEENAGAIPVHQKKGNLFTESTKDKTIFAKALDPESSKAFRKRIPRLNLREKRILLIEDNIDVRNYLHEQLIKEYEIFEANNGKEGLEQALEEIPDLIITDVMMPGMDGYELSRELKNDEKTSHIPVIILTAKAALDDKVEGLETGADVYLTKPFSAKELKIRVFNLIKQRDDLRKRFSRSTLINPEEAADNSIDKNFLERILKIIHENIDNEDLNVDKLAGDMNMSVSQLNRKLNALVDQPGGQLIRSFRLQRAAEMLNQNAGSIAEICYNVGFNDQAYFSRSFKKQFGYSPRDFKNNGNNLRD